MDASKNETWVLVDKHPRKISVEQVSGITYLCWERHRTGEPKVTGRFQFLAEDAASFAEAFSQFAKIAADQK